MGTILAVPTMLAVGLVLKPDFRPWIRLYKRPGFSVASFLVRLWLWLSLRLRIPRGRDFSLTWKDGPEKFGLVPSKTDLQAENAKCLDRTSKHAVDAVQFCGVNDCGDCLMVRMARRHDEKGEILLYLKLANGESYVLPSHPRSECRIMKQNAFSASGLNISCLHPFRTWRISYNGLARNTEDSSLKHLKFSFIWCCNTETYDHLTDFSKSLLADNITESGLTGLFCNLRSVQDVQDQYEQWGNFVGTFVIDGASERELNLWGLRTRFGGQWNWEVNNYLKICGYMQDGLSFHFGILSLLSSTLTLKHGYISFPNGTMQPIDDSSIEFDDFALDNEPPSDMNINLYAGRKEYRLKMMMSSDGWKVNTGFSNQTCLTGRLVTFALDDEVGRGFCEYSLRCYGNQSEPTDISSLNTNYILKEPDVSRTAFIPSVVSLTDTLCQCAWVAGGKGASLALMTRLENKISGHQFTIPKGVVISSAAYRHHMEGHPFLRKLVQQLQEEYGSSNLEKVRGMCERVTNEFRQLPIGDNLKHTLRQRLQEIFGSRLHHVRFAVRSSGVGEDSGETSAAGQMETILGVTTLDEMHEAIKRCWASQFSFTSVQYNRQNGQIINNDMAVVIQEMVAAEIAGVAFTCDPASGDSRFVTISANYGLGESVVSAASDPDSVVLKKLPNHAVEIESVAVGEKKTKVSMNETGTIVEDVSEDKSKQCCISEAQAIHLGTVALLIEDSFGDPRDIEWAFVGSNLFLLQARPITTWDLETEFELIHEFDTGLLTDSEYMSRANTGEVMPGAITPLTLSTCIAFLNQGSQTMAALDMGQPLRRNFSTSIAVSHWQVMFSLLPMFQATSKPESEMSLVDRCWELAFFGRIIDEGPELRQRFQHRFGKQWFVQLNGLLSGIKSSLGKGKQMKKAQRQYLHYHFPVENCNCAADVYQCITENLTALCQSVHTHILATVSSGFLNAIVISIVAGQQTEVTGDLFGDLSKLLSNCKDIESADVPQALEELAETVREQIQTEDFVGMSVEEALRWLQNNDGPSGEKYRHFILQHGHRCLKEFDLMSRPWEMNPDALVKSLQMLLRAPTPKQSTRKPKAESDIIEDVKTPLNWFSKKLLRHLVRWSRQGVSQREKSKSMLIGAVHILRKAYLHLASMMVKEGRLPDTTLIFFLTHHEIGQLLDTRSARLISKAVRRRRLYGKLDSWRFPEITCGIPRPVNLEPNLEANNIGTTLRGTPVCQGIVKSTARVVLNLEEAETIQANDILVTHATDIGWTPYFPLLSGIATELGGLISHGAVVAREYGIPCVVGLHGATMVFKSGDHVVLNGHEGILQKIEE